MLLNDQVIIRDACSADLEAMALLVTDLGYPTSVAEMQARFNAVADHPDYRTILAVVNNRVVGMAGLMKGFWYEKNGRYLRILAFVVKQGTRNLGIGKVLLKAAEDWAQEQGLNSVIINSGNRDERAGAHAFYQKMGYAIKSSGFIKQV